MILPKVPKTDENLKMDETPRGTKIGCKSKMDEISNNLIIQKWMKLQKWTKKD